METHTIVTNNSRRTYIFHYFIFVLLVTSSSYYLFLGKVSPQILIAAIVAVFAGVSATEIHRISQTYEVNPHSVIHTKGYIARHSKRINLLAINDVLVTKTLYQRLFKMGDIHVRVANSENPTVLKNLHKPHIFAETIEKNISKLHSSHQQTPI